jgi:predicted  nucleic acid-binding Zn-ribbon protein
MASHLEDIVKLQAALTELSIAQAQLSGIPDWMQDLHAQHSGRLAEIASLEEAVETARRERREAETAIAEAQERLKRYQQQINQVSTQREYGALLQEIDTAKGQMSTAEDLGLAAMERREQAEAALAACREGFAEVDARYRQELARWEQEKPEIAARIDDLSASIAVLRERLPRGILANFDRIRERHQGSGLAPIQEVDRGGRGPRVWHCGACNYSVRPQVVVEIRSSGTMVQCDGCKRILYLPNEGTG